MSHLRISDRLQDFFILLFLCVVFCLHYFHSHFLFQGDVLLNLYLHSNAELFKAGWDPYSWGYMGWYPIVGGIFPLNALMHCISNWVFSNSLPAALILLQINAVISLTLLGFFTYLFLRFLERGRTASLVGAMAVCFCGFHVQAGLRELDLFYLHSFMFVPLVLICLVKANRENSIPWALCAGLMIGLSLLGGGNVPMFMFVPCLPFVFLFDHSPNALLDKKIVLRGLFLFSVAVISGMIVGAVLILPSMEYMPYSMRSGFVTGVFDHGSCVTPLLMVLKSIYREWWGFGLRFDHEQDCFVGWPLMILAVLGLWGRERSPGRYFIYFICTVALLQMNISAMPRFVQDLWVFVHSKMSIRYPARFFMVFLFGLSYFAALGVDLLEKLNEAKKREAWFLLVASGIYVLFGSLVLSRSMDSSRVVPFLWAMFFSAAVSIQIGLVLIFPHWKQWLFSIVITLAALFMSARPDTPVRNLKIERVPVKEALHSHFDVPVSMFQPSDTDGSIPFRVYNSSGGGARSNYWAPRAGVGIAFEPMSDPAMPLLIQKYREVMTRTLARNSFSTNWDSPLLDLYNVKYLNLPGYQGNRLKKTAVPGIWENPFVLGRFFLIKGARFYDSEKKIYEALRYADVEDLRSRVYLLRKDEPKVPFRLEDGRAAETLGEKIGIRTELPHRIDLEVTIGKDGFLCVSELWFPAWKAYVDGKPVSLLKAYGTFWAVPLLEGTHSVSFIFQDRVSSIGRWISVFAGTGLILYLGVNWLFRRKKEKGAISEV